MPDLVAIRKKLNAFVNKLPKKMRFPFILVNTEEALMFTLHNYFNINHKPILRSMSVPPCECRVHYALEQIKARPKHQFPIKGPMLYGFSTNPILINCISNKLNHIIFVYLHEAGHLQGQKCKLNHKIHINYAKYFTEDIADDIAGFYLKKFWKRSLDNRLSTC